MGRDRRQGWSPRPPSARWSLVALINHNTQPTAPAPGHSATAAPTPSPSAAVAVATDRATAPPVAVGPAGAGLRAHRRDRDQLRSSGGCSATTGASCTAASCTRIVHTTDGGSHFTSIPTPPVAPASNSQQAAAPALRRCAGRLGRRAARARSGRRTTVVRQWASDSAAGPSPTSRRRGAPSSRSSACPTGPASWSSRRPPARTAGRFLPASAEYRPPQPPQRPGHPLWAAIQSPGRVPAASCSPPSTAGRASPAHACARARWASPTCTPPAAACCGRRAPPGRRRRPSARLDGGQTFTQLSAPMSLPNFASIAGPSATTAVIAGQRR